MLAFRAAARASGGPRVDYPTTARIVLFGAGAGVLSASVGGLAVDFCALRRSGTAPRVAIRRVLAVGTLEWTVLSLHAVLAATVVLFVGPESAIGMALAWVIALPVCLSAALWPTSPSRVRRFINHPPEPPETPEGRRA